jgi:cytochrome bd ubiquinol oxidase subunit II
VLTGLALMVGYGPLGACWLVWKAEGELQDRMRVQARWLGLLNLVLIALVSLVMPSLQSAFRERWFSFPNLILAQPVLAVVLAWRFFAALNESEDLSLAGVRARAQEIAAYDGVPFLCALGLFLLAYVGLGIYMWPMIVPTEVTIWEAAAPRTSQAFLLAGAAVLIPNILTYTAYVYWLFRGKVRAGEGYH